MPEITAAAFIARLQEHQSDVELAKIQRYFKSGTGDYGEGDVFMGVRMGSVFELAKQHIGMQPDQIELLMESPVHEVRAGAMSIMDKQGRDRKTTDERRRELYDLYLRRHDRINNWDLVDLAAGFVVGRYLHDKPRDVLYELAKSQDVWRRRTAITATSYYLRVGEVDDTLKVGQMLLYDEHDLIQKAVGGWLRVAGTHDEPKLLALLDEHAATMPRTALRYALERLSSAQKKHYMGLKATLS